MTAISKFICLGKISSRLHVFVDIWGWGFLSKNLVAGQTVDFVIFVM